MYGLGSSIIYLDPLSCLRTQPRKDLMSKLPCQICGEARYTENCHIIPREADLTLKRMKLYKANLIILCPTHHVYFDNGLLSKKEFEKIGEQVYKMVYKFITGYNRWSKWVNKGIKKHFNIDIGNNKSLLLGNFSDKIDRGLLRKQWLKNLIQNS